MNVFSGTMSAPDGYGRGTITTSIPGTSFATTVIYYMVNSRALRLVDMDGTDVAGDSSGQSNRSNIITERSPTTYWPDQKRS